METFDKIILTGRAASGKSELIDFLKKLSVAERIAKFHIGEFAELDDHQWIWALGENDDMWEQLGKPRYYTKDVGVGYVEADDNDVFWEFLDLKINREVKDNSEDPAFFKQKTLFIEFARGGEDGYAKFFAAQEEETLQNTAVFFLNNSYEDCVRRNEERYEEQKKHTVLAHKVPDECMHTYYRTHDWDTLTEGKESGYLNIQGVKIPFVTIANEPEVTDPKLIEERFAPPLTRLWELYSQR